MVYSQLGQDDFVLEKSYYKDYGFFVEAGAMNGIKLSNTYKLEKDYNWNGICCEPNSNYHKALSQNRSCAVNFNLLYDENGKTIKLYKGGMAGGTEEDFKAEEGRYEWRMSQPTEYVKTITLNTLLEQYNAPPIIDYISLDTEGSELRILKAFNFKKRDVKIWSIEHNTEHRNDGDKYLNSIIKLMTENEYTFIPNQNDSYFVSNA